MRRALFMVGKIVLVVVALPFAMLAGLATSLGGLKARRSASEVAAYLRDFVEGRGGPWDWDDFTSAPLADPRLAGIRRRAAAVALPPTEEGMAVLRQLLNEAEQLAEESEDEAATAFSRAAARQTLRRTEW